MDIRFQNHATHADAALADHARRRLWFRLLHRSDRVVHVAVRFGDTGSRRGRHDTYCAVRVQLDGIPAATVVDIGADAYDTIDRAADRAGRFVEEQLRMVDAGPRPGMLLEKTAR